MHVINVSNQQISSPPGGLRLGNKTGWLESDAHGPPPQVVGLPLQAAGCLATDRWNHTTDRWMPRYELLEARYRPLEAHYGLLDALLRTTERQLQIVGRPTMDHWKPTIDC